MTYTGFSIRKMHSLADHERFASEILSLVLDAKHKALSPILLQFDLAFVAHKFMSATPPPTLFSWLGKRYQEFAKIWSFMIIKSHYNRCKAKIKVSPSNVSPYFR